jgi:subtilase family serine protease
MSIKTRLLMCLLALGVLPIAMADTAAAARATPLDPSAQALDQGALRELSASTPISVTVALRLSDLDAAETLLASLNTPGDPQYRQFLTADQFVARFAPSKSDVAKAIAALSRYGLTVTQATATTLRATGLPADMERAFAVSLHSYSVPSRGAQRGYTYHAPLSRVTVPTEISSVVAAVIGLDSRPNFRPLSTHANFKQVTKPSAGPSGSLNPFGFLTVTDFASLYDVQPLYQHGVTGRGRTLGIMSLANFTPSDVFAYWSALGLQVDPNRLKIINVDGGPGPISDDGGSLETTIDVEQSGGIAPGAKILVYLAPNTNQAFVDLFAAAIDSNQADTLSISWGGWEWFDNLENSPVTDPSTGRNTSAIQAVHELLVRAAIQGQTVFTAQGDGGAYEANHDLGCLGPYSASQPDSCSLTLSVGYPGSDPAITSAGGTTLPGQQELCLNAACTTVYDVNVPNERVWGWDYLIGFCSALGADPIDCGIFPAGTGGGVSIAFLEPWYQFFTSGTQWSQPGQVFQAGSDIVKNDGIGGFFALPAFFPGRNVPDISFNADPQTGYIVFYTSSVSGYGEQPFWGGTSFVAPQLNGVSALYGQYVHGRLGLLNPSLYAAQYRRRGPLDPIAYGDNWFYHGRNGYSPAVGLGTLDVAEFAKFLSDPF